VSADLGFLGSPPSPAPKTTTVKIISTVTDHRAAVQLHMDLQVEDIRVVLAADNPVDQQVDTLVDRQSEVALEADFHLQSTYIAVDC